MPSVRNPADLADLRTEHLSAQKAKPIWITVCTGTGCCAYGAESLADGFENEIVKRGLSRQVGLRRTGCHGFCERGPLVVIQPKGVCYLHAQVKDIPTIIEKTVLGDEVVTRLLYLDDQTGKRIQTAAEIPFYKYQKRILLENNVLIDATSILDYVGVGGYTALAKALHKMTPDGVIQEVKRANLRGRGGAGFSAGYKWETTRNAPGARKYVIVNGDEGDPGAYMDRSLLEGNPHSVLEGLIIGAYAIGAAEGFIYVRQEYPLARQHAQMAIDRAREYGFLGTNILGSGFDFDVTIHRGAGAFVSGESSALVNAIEGHVGEPRPKYTHLSEKGLWGKPTCLNNVETWANVPHIVNRGSDWFRSMGTENSKGTKIFSLIGRIQNTGLVEVPMGISLREIICDIGGGVKDGKALKAVQTGGPAGGCVPASLIDLPIDYDSLVQAGSMMGSGGMVVMDETTCMVDVARYFLDFLQDESCGKCVPCRIGTRQMLEILTRITRGLGEPGDILRMEELAATMKAASLCGLGQSAANPVLSTLRYFRDEYEAHILRKTCPARVCKEIVSAVPASEEPRR